MRRPAVFFWLILCALLLAVAARAEKAALIENGSEALGVRIAAIRNARSEILISTFLLRNDAATAAIHQALIDAAQRGVKVRYAVDGSMLALSEHRDSLTLLAQHGVDTRIAKQFDWNFWHLYNRQHDKLFIVDGQKVITGGRNHWEESFGLGPNPHHDVELLIEGGKAVAETRAYFYRTWDESKDNYLRSALPAERQKRAEDNLRKAADLAQSPGFDRAGFERGLALRPTESVTDLQFIWDHFRFEEAGPNHIDYLIPLIDGAHDTLRMEMPWLVLTDKVKRALVRAKRRGVNIQILTNSAETTEVPYRDAVTRSSSRLFLQTYGIDLQEFAGGYALHSKYIIADGKRAYHGSFNLGIRSQYNNSETGWIFESPTLIQNLEAIYSSRLAQARPSPRYGWRDHPCLNLWASLLRAQF